MRQDHTIGTKPTNRDEFGMFKYINKTDLGEYINAWTSIKEKSTAK